MLNKLRTLFCPYRPSQAAKDAVMRRYANREIGIRDVTNELQIHLMDAYQLLAEYQIELPLTIEDVQRDLEDIKRARH